MFFKESLEIRGSQSRAISGQEMLRVEVSQVIDEHRKTSGSDCLARAFYRSEGPLDHAEIYPLTAGIKNWYEDLRIEGIGEEDILSWEEAGEREWKLLLLSETSYIKVTPLDEPTTFKVSGIANEVPGGLQPLGIRQSGERFLWDEYYFEVATEEGSLSARVFSPLSPNSPIKCLTFPLAIPEYDQVFRLLTADGADWRELPELFPVKVELRALE